MPLSTGNADFRLYVLHRARSEGKGARPHIRVSGKRKQCAERHGGHVACCSQRLKPRMVGGVETKAEEFCPRGGRTPYGSRGSQSSGARRLRRRHVLGISCSRLGASWSLRGGTGTADLSRRTPTATGRGIDARPVWLSSLRRT